MSNYLSDRATENLKIIQMSNTKNIKFYKDDQLIVKQDQKKVISIIDDILYKHDKPEIIEQISTELITFALKSIERTPNSFLRQQLKTIFNMCVAFNQIDEDIRLTHDGREATKTLLFIVNNIYIENFDINILNTRIIKDILINAIKKGTLDTSHAIDQIKSIMDSPENLYYMETAKRHAKKLKGNE